MRKIVAGVTVFYQPLDLRAGTLKLAFQQVVLIAKLRQRFVELSEKLVLVGDRFFKTNQAALVGFVVWFGHGCKGPHVMNMALLDT